MRLGRPVCCTCSARPCGWGSLTRPHGRLQLLPQLRRALHDGLEGDGVAGPDLHQPLEGVVMEGARLPRGLVGGAAGTALETGDEQGEEESEHV